MKLEEAISTIEASGSMDELRVSLHRIVQDYGFSAFNFIDAGRPEIDVPYYIGTHPPAWERLYLQNQFVHSDPALARVRRTNTPFSWSEVELPAQNGRKRSPQRKVMDAAREFGFANGFVIPFHYRDRMGAMYSSATVFFWESEPSAFEKLLACHRHELHLLMIYWVQRAMHIADRDRNPTMLRPTEAALSVQLTAREREVMAWAARGKTAADTAQILGISTETVVAFIKQAVQKLNASNKTHGVAKSLALGLIDF